MKLLLVLSITVCLVWVAYSAKSKEGKCFKLSKGDWKAKIKERIEKKYKPVIEACKAENPKADDKEIKKCCKKKMKEAWGECRSAKSDDKGFMSKMKAQKKCMQEKLHIEKTEQKNLTKEEMKDKIVKNLISDDKKEAVNTAIAKCNSQEGREYWLCCLQEIANGPCPEVKSVSDKIISWKKKYESDKSATTKKA